MDEIDDLEVDDITENVDKKKRVNGSVKGKVKERSLATILNKRFSELLGKNPSWGSFSRSIGSGNRWGQVSKLPQHAKETFTGDLTCPNNFKFVMESKAGYDDKIELHSLFSFRKQKEATNAQLDEFIRQAEGETERLGKPALIMWQKTWKPKLAIIKDVDLSYFSNYMVYRDWKLVSFDKLLAFPDEFFFQL